MYKRILEIENMLDGGIFLLGARQTGKSTLFQERFPDAICYDLLNLIKEDVLFIASRNNYCIQF